VLAELVPAAWVPRLDDRAVAVFVRYAQARGGTKARSSTSRGRPESSLHYMRPRASAKRTGHLKATNRSSHAATSRPNRSLVPPRTGQSHGQRGLYARWPTVRV
jgi:hypothetical protein